ncbi:hypothetical protein GIB67_009566 [Kingdonia uniflora]|uniref:RNase H type-1 domain-containing protein n=1 Tax=Kingdonia uniflora TaxID=39325 RepID=A0A7J7NW38_9MAGN|nr:hypothetical protein GIB67_009566 [Kingdonia uniflora]
MSQAEQIEYQFSIFHQPCWRWGNLRDEKGDLVLAYVHGFGVCTNTAADILAPLQGLRICLAKGWFDIIMEVDSQVIVNWYKNMASVPWSQQASCFEILRLGALLRLRWAILIEKEMVLHMNYLNQETLKSGASFFNKTSEGETSDGWEEEDETESEIGDGWEEEDETESEIGDGGDGGGVVLRDVPWGEHTLSLAREVLLQFGDDMKLFAFKTTPRGYIYVRLDKISNMYGCPSMEEIANYSKLYKKRLEEVGETGQIPDDLALEVSSPSAERVLKVPEDLDRFKDMPMRVLYVEGESDPKHLQKDGVFLLDSIKTESEHCVWKLANVKENRDPLSKGKPLNRKQKDWRLTLPYPLLKKVTLYLS